MSALRDSSGQMTVELVVVLPVFIVLGLLLANALFFVSECSAFDRTVRNAVRAQCAVPGMGQSVEQGASSVAATLADDFNREGMETDVEVERRSGGCVAVRATLRFHPSLFGLRTDAFGVSLPAIEHSETMVVDPYRSGVLI